MKFEDHFSELASIYSKFRPTYPQKLFEYLASCCREHKLAWDCGTGSGQAAVSLTEYFEKVYASDASKEQLAQAPSHSKIIFKNENPQKKFRLKILQLIL